MRERFEFQFVTARPNDMARLAAAGAEGWTAVGMVPADEGAVSILLERKVVVETQKTPLEARDGWLPIPHQDTSR